MVNLSKYSAISDLQIEALKEKFAVNIEFTTADILAFYQEFQPKVPKSTVNWRVYELVKTGVLERAGRGRFIRGTGPRFYPPIRLQLKKLSEKIKTKFPYIQYCLWENDIVRSFQQHLSSSRFILIDVEKESMQAVFEYLKENFKHIWLKPDTETIYHYILPEKQSIIVRHLISEAPLQTCENIPTVTIEKMLVDLFTDNEFEYLEGTELVSVFRNARDRFPINQSKLLRYAGRKGQRQELQAFLEKNNFIKKSFNSHDF